jgi:hypothetical protein
MLWYVLWHLTGVRSDNVICFLISNNTKVCAMFANALMSAHVVHALCYACVFKCCASPENVISLLLPAAACCLLLPAACCCLLLPAAA